MSDKRGVAFTKAIGRKETELADVRAAFAAYRADVEPVLRAAKKTWDKLGELSRDLLGDDETDILIALGDALTNCKALKERGE